MTKRNLVTIEYFVPANDFMLQEPSVGDHFNDAKI